MLRRHGGMSAKIRTPIIERAVCRRTLGRGGLEIVLANMESASQRKKIFMSHQVSAPD